MQCGRPFDFLSFSLSAALYMKYRSQNYQGDSDKRNATSGDDDQNECIDDEEIGMTPLVKTIVSSLFHFPSLLHEAQREELRLPLSSTEPAASLGHRRFDQDYINYCRLFLNVRVSQRKKDTHSQYQRSDEDVAMCDISIKALRSFSSLNEIQDAYASVVNSLQKDSTRRCTENGQNTSVSAIPPDNIDSFSTPRLDTFSSIYSFSSFYNALQTVLTLMPSQLSIQIVTEYLIQAASRAQSDDDRDKNHGILAVACSPVDRTDRIRKGFLLEFLGGLLNSIGCATSMLQIRTSKKQKYHFDALLLQHYPNKSLEWWAAVAARTLDLCSARADHSRSLPSAEEVGGLGDSSISEQSYTFLKKILLPRRYQQRPSQHNQNHKQSDGVRLENVVSSGDNPQGTPTDFATDLRSQLNLLESALPTSAEKTMTSDTSSDTPSELHSQAPLLPSGSNFARATESSAEYAVSADTTNVTADFAAQLEHELHVHRQFVLTSRAPHVDYSGATFSAPNHTRGKAANTALRSETDTDPESECVMRHEEPLREKIATDYPIDDDLLVGAEIGNTAVGSAGVTSDVGVSVNEAFPTILFPSHDEEDFRHFSMQENQKQQSLSIPRRQYSDPPGCEEECEESLEDEETETSSFELMNESEQGDSDEYRNQHLVNSYRKQLSSNSNSPSRAPVPLVQQSSEQALARWRRRNVTLTPSAEQSKAAEVHIQIAHTQGREDSCDHLTNKNSIPPWDSVAPFSMTTHTTESTTAAAAPRHRFHGSNELAYGCSDASQRPYYTVSATYWTNVCLFRQLQRMTSTFIDDCLNEVFHIHDLMSSCAQKREMYQEAISRYHNDQQQSQQLQPRLDPSSATTQGIRNDQTTMSYAERVRRRQQKLELSRLTERIRYIEEDYIDVLQRVDQARREKAATRDETLRLEAEVTDLQRQLLKNEMPPEMHVLQTSPHEPHLNSSKL